MKEIETNSAATLAKEENRSRYETPRLIQYGSIHAITSTAALGSFADFMGSMVQ